MPQHFDLSRRTMLRMLAGSTLGLLACSAPAPSPAAAPTSAAARPASGLATPVVVGTPAAAPGKPTLQPKTGGTLRIARQGDYANNYYPWQSAAAAGLTIVTAYERLIRYDANMQPQMWLAENVELSTDARQLKISLRKGVQFHNGKELTADDVIYSLKKVRDPLTNATQHAALSNWFGSWETPDKYTVILKSDKPRAGALDLLEYLLIADEATLESPGGDQKINGTGPWTLADRKIGVSWDFVKSKNYWRSGRPYLDGFHIDLYDDAQAKTVAFESGAADIIEGASLRDVARYEREQKYGLVGLPGFLYLLAVNVSKPPFDKKAARQALHYAVDRQRMIDTVFAGKGEPRNLPWGSASEAFEPAKAGATPFDLDKARSLLAQAGVTSANIEIISNAPLVEVGALTQILQSDFAKIGLNATLKPLETAAWGAAGLAREFSGINAALTSFINIRPTTLPYTSAFFLVKDNRSGWENPDYVRLVEEAGTEPDLTKRKQVLSQLNDLLLDEAPVIYIGAANTYLVGQPNVHDFLRDNNYGMVLHDTWIG
jgi:peptide/nickel transport system substrate-binding protein